MTSVWEAAAEEARLHDEASAKGTRETQSFDRLLAAARCGSALAAAETQVRQLAVHWLTLISTRMRSSSVSDW